MAHLYSFKYVNGHPKNTAQGLLTVTAFGVLADVATGYPVLLSELTFTTALRTAAMSALAARHMARPSSRTMALIGNGAQAEFQALAFYHLLGIRELRLFDTDAAATAKLERNLGLLQLPGLQVTRCRSTAEAVQGADIVTTATADKCNATILLPQMIEAGMHLNAIGGDCPGKTELHGDILRRPDARVVVEFEPQSRIEGEIQQTRADIPRHRVRGRAERQGAGAHVGSRRDDLRFRRLRARGFLGAALPASPAPGRARHEARDRPAAGAGRSRRICSASCRPARGAQAPLKVARG